MYCSFCAHYGADELDSAKRVVVMNGHSVCLDHMAFCKDGDWLLQLSQTERLPE